MREGNKYLEKIKGLFYDKSGVYVLYRDDIPYYIGKADKLFSRIRHHAISPNARYYNFWNYFTAFVIDKEYIDEVEGILINAMPSAANNSKPKIKKIKLPSEVTKQIRERLINQHSSLSDKEVEQD